MISITSLELSVPLKFSQPCAILHHLLTAVSYSLSGPEEVQGVSQILDNNVIEGEEGMDIDLLQGMWK